MVGDHVLRGKDSLEWSSYLYITTAAKFSRVQKEKYWILAKISIPDAYC